MTPGAFIPARGDVMWLDLSPVRGHEQDRVRPVLVLSPVTYNGPTRLCVACSITSIAKGYPFEVEIPDGLAVTGVVLADQIRCLDWSQRRPRFICQVPVTVVNQVILRLQQLLGAVVLESDAD